MPNQNNQTMGRKRIYFMDELRGFAVFCMVFYHGFYTLAYLYNLKAGMILLHFFMPAEPFYAGLFMLISGVSSNLSHSNLARGLKLLGISLAVTLATYFFVPDELIVFGILHFLSVCMILYGLIKPVSDRFRFSWAAVAVCVLLFVCTLGISRGYLGFSPQFGIRLPDALYSTNWLAPLGIFNDTFRSADYFPLFPWVFVFAAGTFLGKLAAQGRFPAFTYRSRVPFFSWLGRYALIIYVLHQPVIYGVCAAVSAVVHLFKV
nr:heparan-alpha-glucosaminide N-acetyltransferase [uncultured Caproiciproducens sp.]